MWSRTASRVSGTLPTILLFEKIPIKNFCIFKHRLLAVFDIIMPSSVTEFFEILNNVRAFSPSRESNDFVITLIFCITTGYLIFLLHVRGWLFISLSIVICCKTLAMVLCFCGDHITSAKLCKNFCVSDSLCNCLNLSLNLKSLAHVQLHITIIFITKEVSWCKIFQTDTAPRQFYLCFSTSLIFKSFNPNLFNFMFFFIPRLFRLTVFSNAIFTKETTSTNSLSLNRKHRFFN